MILFVKEAGEGLSPGGWNFNSKQELVLGCPKCQNAILLGGAHRVVQGGVVVPAVRCPLEDCGFAGAVRLEGHALFGPTRGEARVQQAARLQKEHRDRIQQRQKAADRLGALGADAGRELTPEELAAREKERLGAQEAFDSAAKAEREALKAVQEFKG